MTRWELPECLAGEIQFQLDYISLCCRERLLLAWLTRHSTGERSMCRTLAHVLVTHNKGLCSFFQNCVGQFCNICLFTNLFHITCDPQCNFDNNQSTSVITGCHFPRTHKRVNYHSTTESSA